MDGLALDPWMLRRDWREAAWPFALVDLAAWPADAAFDPLPPMPLIGIGDPAHPLAAALDALIEPPVTLAAVRRGILATPLAAVTLVQLLRATALIDPAAALTAESFAMATLQAGAEHGAWLAKHPPSPPGLPGALHLMRAGDTLALCIDRPHARNAIDRALRDALFDAFALSMLDPEIARITLVGAGRSFSMGADLSEFGTTRDPAAAHAIRMRTLPAWPLARRTARFEVHVHGACVGAGVEIAAFADRLTSAPDSWFQLPELGMGILPGAGGTVSLPRRIGRQRAALMMLSGRRIPAAIAKAWGLVDEITGDEGGAHAGG